jgi:hypothetical protein
MSHTQRRATSECAVWTSRSRPSRIFGNSEDTHRDEMNGSDCHSFFICARSHDVSPRSPAERDCPRHCHAGRDATRGHAVAYVQCPSHGESVVCVWCHGTNCIALHLFAIGVTSHDVRPCLRGNEDRNHTATLATTQHVATRWPTCDLPRWHTPVGSRPPCVGTSRKTAGNRGCGNRRGHKDSLFISPEFSSTWK